MTRRLTINLALALMGAFALAAAVPALACDCDHKKGADCDHHGKKGATEADKKADPKAAPADKTPKPSEEKKAEAGTAGGVLLAGGCDCGAKEAKDCKCGSGCKCTEKKDKPKASNATPARALLAGGCNCEKGGKNCTCPKGECKCPNCSEKAKARAAA